MKEYVFNNYLAQSWHVIFKKTQENLWQFIFITSLLSVLLVVTINDGSVLSRDNRTYHQLYVRPSMGTLRV